MWFANGKVRSALIFSRGEVPSEPLPVRRSAGLRRPRPGITYLDDATRIDPNLFAWHADMRKRASLLFGGSETIGVARARAARRAVR
jgi:hypothetical protein